MTEHVGIDEERFERFVTAVVASSYPAGMRAMGWPEENIHATVSTALRGWLNTSVRDKEQATLIWQEPRGPNAPDNKIQY